MSPAVIATVNVLCIFIIARQYMAHRWFNRALDIVKGRLNKAETVEQLTAVGEDLKYIERYINPLIHAFDLTVWTFEQAFPRFK